MAETESADDKLPDTAALVHRNFRDSRDHSSEWRTQSETWYAMVAGEQWDQTDLLKLQDQQRPAVTFNRILRTINAITGTEIANRQETRFIPREIGDVQVNEVLSSAADWARDNCDAEDEESDAFRDMSICGMGWTETRMDYERDADGEIRIERIDPLEMYWDPGARKKNLSDAQWFMHVKQMPLSDFQARWPDADEDLVTAPWEGAEDDVSKRVHVYPQDAYKEQQGRTGPKAKRMVRVAHMQWAVRKDAYRVGKRAERVAGDKFGKFKERLDKEGIKYVRQQEVTWKRAFVAGGEVLEEGDCPYEDGPTLKCMTFERDRNNGTWFGMVKAMVDPQRFGNKFFSQILDILNKGSKGGVMAEKTAFQDIRQAETKWARADSIIWLQPGALTQNKVQPKPVVELPPGMDRLMGFSLDAVHEVTGINLELLGFANREQPGVLEHQRKQAGLTIIAPLFDAMRRYRKEQGRVLLHFIQKYISDGRLIRIMGQNGQERYVPLAMEDDTVIYDVVVDESPTSPNMKERVYGALVEMLPGLAKLGVPLPPELLDYAPIPSSLAQKWKEQIQQGQQIPPEIKEQMQKLQEENQQLKSKKEEAMAGLQIDDAKAKAEAERKQAEVMTDADLAREKQDFERKQAEEEMALARWKAKQEIDIARDKFEAEMAIKAAQASAGEDGVPDLSKIVSIFRNDEPKRRRISVVRNPESGFIESADIEEVRSQ